MAFERDRQIWVGAGRRSAPARTRLRAQRQPTATRGGRPTARGSRSSRTAATTLRRHLHQRRAPITWLAPSTSRDASPRWSPDGTRIAFVRRPGAGGAPRLGPGAAPPPWAIWTAERRDRPGAPGLEGARDAARLRADDARRHQPALGGAAAASSSCRTQDGWPHLYSIAAGGGEPLLLTPGDYMAEHITPAPGRRRCWSSPPTPGRHADDIDRRHVVQGAGGPRGAGGADAGHRASSGRPS